MSATLTCNFPKFGGFCSASIFVRNVVWTRLPKSSRTANQNEICCGSQPRCVAVEKPRAVERLLYHTFKSSFARAVLEVLYAESDATVPAIAQKLEINRQYVQLMVNETLAENLTVRCKNPRHKKSAIISLTGKGRALIKDVVRREMALVRSIDAGLNRADVEIALKVVTALTEKLKSEIGSN